MVTDRIVLKPNPASEQTKLKSRLGAMGAQVKLKPASASSTEGALEGLGMMVLKVDPAKHLDTLNELAARSDVRLAAPVFKYEPAATPNDPRFSSQYHHNIVGTPTAWDTSKGNSSIIIAILDTGTDASHPDLAANILPGWNFADNNADTSDIKGHGTATAGTAAAVGNNAIGVTGAAWNCRILPGRISDSTGAAYSDTIAAAMKWAADQGAKVINCSFGPLQGDNIIENAANYARGKGALVFVSSGNDGTRDPSPLSPNIIFVGATDASDQIVSWSTSGPAVKLSAPGNSILTTQRGGGYANFSGTSFSCPLAAGIAALVWGANPTLTNSQVENILLTTAKDLGAVGKDERHGYGRIDAAAAMAASVALAPTPAKLTSPAPGSTLSSTAMTFQWTAGSQATEYWLQIGTTPGGKEVMNASVGQSRSFLVNGLPNDGRTLFVKLFSLLGTTWSSNDYVLTAANLPVGNLASITDPGSGATLPGSSATFQWTSGVGATEYWLQLGKTVNGTEYVNRSVGTARSFTVTSLPRDGSVVFGRLWSRIDGAWAANYRDVSYTAAGASTPVPQPALATLSDPVSGTTLSAASVTFSWTAGSLVSEYWLEVGTALGGKTLFGASTGTSRSVTVNNIPLTGSPIFVRLWSKINGAWGANFNDTQFATARPVSAAATLLAPVDGEQLTRRSFTAVWDAVANANEYWIEVGSSQGGNDIAGFSTGRTTSAFVGNLPVDGRTIFIRLWTRIGTSWSGNFRDSTVRASERSRFRGPTSSTLTSSTVTFDWTAGVGVTEYWLEVGKTQGGKEYFGASVGTTLSKTLSNLPADGSVVYARIWSRIDGAWDSNFVDTQFRAVSQ